MVDGTFFLEKLSREREEATNSDNNIDALRMDDTKPRKENISLFSWVFNASGAVLHNLRSAHSLHQNKEVATCHFEFSKQRAVSLPDTLC